MSINIDFFKTSGNGKIAGTAKSNTREILELQKNKVDRDLDYLQASEELFIEITKTTFSKYPDEVIKRMTSKQNSDRYFYLLMLINSEALKFPFCRGSIYKTELEYWCNDEANPKEVLNIKILNTYLDTVIELLISSKICPKVYFKNTTIGTVKENKNEKERFRASIIDLLAESAETKEIVAYTQSKPKLNLGKQNVVSSKKGIEKIYDVHSTGQKYYTERQVQKFHEINTQNLNLHYTVKNPNLTFPFTAKTLTGVLHGKNFLKNQYRKSQVENSEYASIKRMKNLVKGKNYFTDLLSEMEVVEENNIIKTKHPEYQNILGEVQMKNPWFDVGKSIKNYLYQRDSHKKNRGSLFESSKDRLLKTISNKTPKKKAIDFWRFCGKEYGQIFTSGEDIETSLSLMNQEDEMYLLIGLTVVSKKKENNKDKNKDQDNNLTNIDKFAA